jgi:RNA polymerase sigma-70 factor (ECF subfamily)
MDSTSLSLLRQLKETDREEAWQRFVDLYAPLIFHWGQSHGLNPTDASELVQEVMAVLVHKLPEFEYDPSKRFRGWLRTVTVNKARDLQRRQSVRPVTGVEETFATLSGPNGPDLFEQREYQSFLVNRALTTMKAEFPEHAWQACWMFVVEGCSGADVARQLGITENAAYVAKSRVLRRLREELEGLLD